MTMNPEKPALAPALVDRMNDLAEDRLMERVNVGWWIRTIDTDGRVLWSQVDVWMHGTHVPTGRKTVRLLALDPDNADEGIECHDFANTTICCLRKVDARKLGLAALKAGAAV